MITKTHWTAVRYVALAVLPTILKAVSSTTNLTPKEVFVLTGWGVYHVFLSIQTFYDTTATENQTDKQNEKSNTDSSINKPTVV